MQEREKKTNERIRIFTLVLSGVENHDGWLERLVNDNMPFFVLTIYVHMSDSRLYSTGLVEVDM